MFSIIYLLTSKKKNTRSKERDNELFQNIFSTEKPIKFKGKDGLMKKKKKRRISMKFDHSGMVE